MITDEDISAFDKTFETLVTELTTSDGDPDIQSALNWLKIVLLYNVPHGKKNRGLATVSSFKHFMPKCKEEEVEKSRLLGWCVEFLQAYFLVVDDIIDHSVTRRGMKCWHLNDGVGTIALNDGMLIRSSLFSLIKNHFKNHECYIDILHLFLSSCHLTEIGQCIDCLTTPEGARPDFTLLTDKRYAAIVKYKTAFYSFDLPVRAAMFLAGIKDEAVHNEAQKILLRIGHLFQSQDDYLDCYGNPEVTGKIGTDIEDGKCSWIAVQAIKRMSDEQRKTFEANYGNKDEDSVKKVKLIYEELKMKNVFLDFEESEFKEINKQISEMGKSTKIDVKLFNGVLNVIYKRDK